MTETSLQNISNRQQMVRFFDGYASERKEELDERKLKGPLVKTQLFEVLNGTEAVTSQRLCKIFNRRDVDLRQFEDNLFKVTDNQCGEIGILEKLSSRIIALYSILKSKDFKPWAGRIVQDTTEIDYVWLSGLTLNVLWELIAKLNKPHRFTSLTFTHESIFAIDTPVYEHEDSTEDDIENSEDEDFGEIIERRKTRFNMVDKIGVIKTRLAGLQNLYAPLYAISKLRFPSPVSPGGHDFCYDGWVTNRSTSFRDHRSHILFVTRIYERLLKATEEDAWYSIKESIREPKQFRKIVGAPIVIRFEEPLSDEVFNQWVSATFKRKINRFRLWGHPIELGNGKIHVYGVDRHLWQPLFLEFTKKGCTAIIPNGTCGNTVHRLVTNIQKYLDPGAKAFIGDKPYQQMVEESVQGVSYDPNSE
jgi:hypothetical protein